jgi:hypothetical protein
MYCKYIVLKKNFIPILFHSAVEHVEEANGREVRSAGFVRINFETGGISCIGGSTSLGGILADPEIDEILIKKMLGNL